MEQFRWLAERLDRPVSSVMQTMWDHCFHPSVFNEIFPSLSGGIGGVTKTPK
jgi:hypothetical protein